MLIILLTKKIYTHEMNSSSPMDNLELVPFDLNSPIVMNSPSIIDLEKECFPTTDGLFIKNSCSGDSYDLILSYNHQHVLSKTTTLISLL
jgi:hypothetical protein